jgi:hypothetical protein
LAARIRQDIMHMPGINTESLNSIRNVLSKTVKFEAPASAAGNHGITASKAAITRAAK